MILAIALLVFGTVVGMGFALYLAYLETEMDLPPRRRPRGRTPVHL